MEGFAGRQDSDFAKGSILGVGNVGSVVEMTHVQTGQKFAGKLIDRKILSPAKKSAMERDIGHAMNLKSKYVVKCYGSVEHEGKTMLITDLAELGSIRDIIDSHRKTLNERQVAFVLHDVLNAVAFFHGECQKVHLDIKAGNLLFDSKCEVKVADFGVSRMFAADNLEAPFWMAPEVIVVGYNMEFPCDIWSIGATAVEMAEGNPPYEKLGAARALVDIPNGLFTGLDKSRGFSKDFTEFVSACMDMNPLQRPTAEQLLQHPFIRQTDGLNRVEVFGALAKQPIQFSNLLEEVDEQLDNYVSLENEAENDAPPVYTKRMKRIRLYHHEGESVTEERDASTVVSEGPAPGGRTSLHIAVVLCILLLVCTLCFGLKKGLPLFAVVIVSAYLIYTRKRK